jgi:hypothetical protein
MSALPPDLIEIPTFIRILKRFFEVVYWTWEIVEGMAKNQAGSGGGYVEEWVVCSG